MGGPIAETGSLLVQLGLALIVGFLTFRFNLVTEKQGLSFVAGRIGLPLLAFKAIVSAELGNLEAGVIISCTAGKACVYLLACIASFTAFRKEPRDTRLISAAIFSFHVTAANDFVFGMPIVESLFPDAGPTQLAANIVVQNVLFQTTSLVMLGIGNLQRLQRLGVVVPAGNADGSPASVRRCSLMARQLLQDPLICAIAAAVLYKGCVSLAWPTASSGQTLPWILLEVIEFFVKPFPMIALFLTGANLAGAFDRGNPAMQRSNLHRVGIPVALVLAKNILCPFVTLAMARIVVSAAKWHDFAFLYGLIPTSSAPILVAMRVGVHVEVVAMAVCMGIVVAVPMLVASSVLLGKAVPDQLEASIGATQTAAAFISALAASVALVFCRVLAKRGGAWLRFPQVMLVWYGLACLLFAVATILDRATGCKSEQLLRLFIFFRMQCRAWAGLMLLHCMLLFTARRLARYSIAIAWLSPLPLCIWVPFRPSDGACFLRHLDNNGAFYATIETFALLALLALAALGFWLRSQMAQAGDPAGRAGEAAGAPDSTATLPLWSAPDSETRGFCRQVSSDNALVEFEPDSPRKFPRSRRSSPFIMDATESAGSSSESRDAESRDAGASPSLPTLPVVAAGADGRGWVQAAAPHALPSIQSGNSLHSPRDGADPKPLSASLGRPLVTVGDEGIQESAEAFGGRAGGDSSQTDSEFTVASLVIASMTLLVSLLSVVFSWTTAFPGNLEPSSLQAMLVERLFEHSNGLFLLIVLCSMFETPCSWLATSLRQRRSVLLQMARSDVG